MAVQILDDHRAVALVVCKEVLIKRINDYIAHWNSNAEPCVWTATADELLAKVRLVRANIKKLLNNNAQ